MSTNVFCIGMGVVASASNSCGSLNSILKMRKQAISCINSFNSEVRDAHVCGQISEYSYMDKFTGMAEQACMEAINDSGLKANELSDNDRAALIVCTSLGNAAVYEEYFRTINNPPDREHPGPASLFPGMMNYLSSFLSNKLGLSGPAYTISNACASGINALALASQLIESETVDICIVGGVEIISELVYSGLDSLKALSKKRSLQPFSKDRDGLIIGEGAGFVVLANKNAARSAKNVYCEIAGYSITNDAAHLTAPDEEAGGLILAINGSIKMSGLDLGDMDCIYCCGTGTVYNDAMQAKAIKRTFGEKSGIPVTTIKPLIGHTMGAAGTIETIAALLMMKEGYLVPLGNPDEYEIDRELEPIHCLFDLARMDINCSMLLGSGFSGVNGSIIFRKASYA